jgi:hypothetical protein
LFGFVGFVGFFRFVFRFLFFGEKVAAGAIDLAKAPKIHDAQPAELALAVLPNPEMQRASPVTACVWATTQGPRV